MKKIRLKTLFIVSLVLTLIFGVFNSSTQAFAATKTNTSSEYVNTVTELETTKLVGGATLYEQKMNSLLNGDSNKAWQEHFVQWVDVESNDDVKLVTWTKSTIDSWSADTTRNLAKDWEKNHPGWIVIAGVNGDFFNNSGTKTWEPLTNFTQDGDMYRANYSTDSYYNVLGITDNNETIVGKPTLTSNMKLYIYDDNNNVKEKLDIIEYNPEIYSSSSDRKVKPLNENGITLLTKDAIGFYDLTGYQVYVGKYTTCRVSNGKSNENRYTVYVDGSIESVRDGKALEKPQLSRDITNDDGTTTTQTVREFYLVTKDDSCKTKLTEGTYVKCQFDFDGDWSEVTQTVGWKYYLLKDGISQNQYSTTDFVYTDHPRTFIGFKADGTPVLMVVDGRGDDTNKGVSLFEGGEIMKLAGCVNAYNLDGGGSSTLIVRNESGGFDVVNRPSDGHERSTGNAVFLVMRESTVNVTNTTTTTAEFTLKDESLINKVVVTINGKEYPMTSTKLVVEGLDMGTIYQAEVTTSTTAETYTSKIPVTTKSFEPQLNFKSLSNGFIVTKLDTDEYLKITAATFVINNKTYKMGNVDSFEIDGLFKNSTYDVQISVTVTNSVTNNEYTIELESREIKTLEWQSPVINTFNVEKNEKRNRLECEYDYTDEDKLVTKVYILVNEDKYELNAKFGTERISNLDFDNNTYNVSLVIEYNSPSGDAEAIKSQVITFSNQECNHEWIDATCTTPKTCKTCGATEGEALGHSWKDATCTTPKTCEHCHETEGEALGHDWIDATTDAPKTCKNCGETKGEPLSKKGCKNSSIVVILSSVAVFSGALYMFRRKK